MADDVRKATAEIRFSLMLSVPANATDDEVVDYVATEFGAFSRSAAEAVLRHAMYLRDKARATVGAAGPPPPEPARTSAGRHPVVRELFARWFGGEN